jgi:hypothetical protein
MPGQQVEHFPAPVAVIKGNGYVRISPLRSRPADRVDKRRTVRRRVVPARREAAAHR